MCVCVFVCVFVIIPAYCLTINHNKYTKLFSPEFHQYPESFKDICYK